MKTRITLILAALLIGFNFSFAQQDEECMVNLQMFSDAAKKGKKVPAGYDEAYKPWMAVRNKCPKFSRAIYQYGEKILKHKIKNASGVEKIAFINDLMKLWDDGNKYFTKYYPLGDILCDKAQLSYKYRKDLEKSNEQLYPMFDDAFTKDLKNFNSAQGLYTYFSLMVDLYDAGKKSPQQLFDKYDDVNDKIEIEVESLSEKLNTLIAKEDAGTELTKKEKKYKKFYEQSLDAYSKISESMDQKLGDRANCEVLIPLYQKDFEENKNNGVWLQRAMNRLFNKGCKEDPMFVKIVEQKNRLEPNAKTSYYLYLITGEQKYFDQTLNLEQDPFKKAKLYRGLAKNFKDKGSYSKAKRYYRESLKLNPSNGRPHLSIAAMYAKSANRCGDSNFNKRAVFWLAAAEARKAGRVDPTLRKAAAQTSANYKAKAPSISEVFQQGLKSGDVIKIGCWIGLSVKVP